MVPPDPPALAEFARFQGRVRFVSVDPERNRARFYTLTWQPALWGGGGVRPAWGPRGSPRRTLAQFYPDRASGEARGERLIRRRLRRGYRVIEWW